MRESKNHFYCHNFDFKTKRRCKEQCAECFLFDLSSEGNALPPSILEKIKTHAENYKKGENQNIGSITNMVIECALFGYSLKGEGMEEEMSHTVADTILTEMKKNENHITKQLSENEEISFNTGFFHGFEEARKRLDEHAEVTGMWTDDLVQKFAEIWRFSSGRTSMKQFKEMVHEKNGWIDVLPGAEETGMKVFEIDEVWFQYRESVSGEDKIDMGFDTYLNLQGYKLIKYPPAEVQEGKNVFEPKEIYHEFLLLSEGNSDINAVRRFYKYIEERNYKILKPSTEQGEEK